MANLTDAYGEIKVKKVGKEFLDYLRAVQSDPSVYYTLINPYELETVKADKNGNLSMPFSNAGRWAFSNNIAGYLGGEWMYDKDKESYYKFLEELVEKKGSVVIDYQDCDTAMDWMGSGFAELKVINGKPNLNNVFDSGRISGNLKGFCELMGFDDEESGFAYLYGEEVLYDYLKYREEWKRDHEFIEGIMEPAGPAEWYDNEYQLTQQG